MAKASRPSPDQVPFDFLVPESSWVPPAELPDLVAWGVRRVALDTEERDDGLAGSRGPGWATGAGYICGVSAAWHQGVDVRSVYAPVRHPDTSNLSAAAVSAWVAHLVRSGVEVVTQNGGFDWGWLGTEWGISPPEEGRIHDTQAAGVMLDENRLSYSLGSMCEWQGVPGKDKSLLQEAGRALGVGQTDREVMSNLWRLPARFVGPYAEGDAEATLLLWDQMEPKIRAQELWEAYRLECDLIPMVVAMRRRGIRIDTEHVERSIVSCHQQRDAALGELSRQVTQGRAVTIGDVNSPRWLEHAFTSEGISFPRTAKTGQGSFQTDWMEKTDHWLPRGVVQASRYHDAADKFLQGFILDYCHRGRLHADIHHLRSDDEERGFRGGTRSHRFSYSDPPLQQMPSPKRDAELGMMVRSAFLPEEGERWGKSDWSQQEFRLMVHFANIMNLPKAADAAERYHSDPKTDFHNLVVEMTGLSRPQAKDVNFARSFGAGIKKFAAMTNRTEAEAVQISSQYDEEFPFIKRLSEECSKVANHRGYIRMIDGARSRFDLWEPNWSYKGKFHPPCSRREADLRVASENHEWYGQQLRRSFTHKAMNRLIQGSAARQCKLAMREIWRQGVTPLLQLHDELDFSWSDPKTPTLVRRAMEEVVSLSVPMLADCEVGPNWGEAEEKL